jgi:hypothetical protein
MGWAERNSRHLSSRGHAGFQRDGFTADRTLGPANGNRKRFHIRYGDIDTTEYARKRYSAGRYRRRSQRTTVSAG